ncbi:MAG TPA: SEC-C metal-binding domain-containing protein [Candidatus Nitrosotenuis sp.]|nr:SEC-C metal-binding domain-containing protein [Candidatus Nitrosotenuis sp.]
MIINIDDVETIRLYLINISQSDTDQRLVSQAKEVLKTAKKEAVDRGDQELSKLIWCYEQILSVQTNYLAAFHRMKEDQYYKGWCLLERVEIELSGLIKHFKWDRLTDEYKISFIEKHTRQFQSLFPYKLFISPAILQLEKVCSTCGGSISIRARCNHQVGEIYNGEMCHRIVRKAEILEISLVTNPVQKYSVPFLKDPKTDQERDHYDYTLVKYVISGLHGPFDHWDVIWTKRRHPHSRFKSIRKDENCPCESGKKYRRCCLRQSGVLRPHVQIIFSVPPPIDLPNIQYT